MAALMTATHIHSGFPVLLTMLLYNFQTALSSNFSHFPPTIPSQIHDFFFFIIATYIIHTHTHAHMHPHAHTHMHT